MKRNIFLYLCIFLMLAGIYTMQHDKTGLSICLWIGAMVAEIIYFKTETL